MIYASGGRTLDIQIGGTCGPTIIRLFNCHGRVVRRLHRVGPALLVTMEALTSKMLCVRFLLPILVCVGLAAESVASDYRFEDLPVGNRAMILRWCRRELRSQTTHRASTIIRPDQRIAANVSISASLYGMGQKRIEASEESSSQFRIRCSGAIGGMYTFDWKPGAGRSGLIRVCSFRALTQRGANESLTILREERLQQGFRVSDETSTTFRSQTRNQSLGGWNARSSALADDYSLVSVFSRSSGVAIHTTGYLDPQYGRPPRQALMSPSRLAIINRASQRRYK